jgi:L-alanine-DL-glutamate epimerase-like enolase superfamily enzyme
VADKMNLKYRSYNLPFKHPFTISKGTKTHQPTLIVELEHFGIKGYGEAPAISYYNITVEKMIEDIEAKRSFIQKFSFTDPERYWHYLHHLIPQNPFLVCALDMAGWDLFGKMKRKKLYELWALDIEKNPLTDFTIGIDTIETMIDKMKETPWPVYKIKLGTEHDIEIITELRKHTNSILRIDANASWNAEEALQKINAFKDLGVELIEQPLAKDDWDGMKFLFERSPIPLFADESCMMEKDVEKCVGYFHGINIKLTKCSGITPARRMITKARELGLKTMLGSMNESTIGSAAIVHLSPLVDYMDVDGPLLLAEDIAAGLNYKDGKVCCSNEPGLGVTPF